MIRSLRTIAESLLELVREREDVREAVHRLSAWLFEQTKPPEPTPTGSPRPPGPIVEVPLQIGGAPEITTHVRKSGLPPVEAAPEVSPSMYDEALTRPTTPTRAGLPTVVRRARLKAEAARWAVQRRHRKVEGADHQAAIKPTDDDLANRARNLENCRLWMLDPYKPLPDDDLLEQIAGNYENLALAANLCRQWRDDHDETAPPENLLYLVAEAQSALRTALESVDVRYDQDQLDLFWWLRDQTYEHQVYIDRHMKLEDPADPTDWYDLESRLNALSDRRESEEHREQARARILNRIRYHITRVGQPDADETAHDWRTILRAVTEWVQLRFYPSDPELCELVVPVFDDLPESIELTSEVEQVLRFVDRLASEREMDSAGAPTLAAVIPPEVREAANLLRGKVVILIGGEVRPSSRARLERDLELAELRWLGAKPHQSLSTYEPHIARDDVALVLLAVRWASHMHGDLAAICERRGKSFVRLPAGYGSAQVANQILNQVSGHLAEVG